MRKCARERISTAAGTEATECLRNACDDGGLCLEYFSVNSILFFSIHEFTVHYRLFAQASGSTMVRVHFKDAGDGPREDGSR